ncbi:EamA family transporter [Paraburkholderia sediminicola]|uniref:EamA family transporter n=1 Tax=Paraburkholderia sediminicola TaxID=458836 RepID=UPI0038BD2B6F
MSTRSLLAFSAIYLVWGSTYLAVAIGLRSFPPMILMGTRCVIGGLILLGWSLLHNQRLPSAQLLIHGVACGLLFFVGCHGVLAIAQQHVPSGIAAVILATIPFWIAMLRFLLPRERRPVPATICALGVGFAGVAVVAWAAPSSGSHRMELPWLAALLGASLSWALGTVLTQRHKGKIPALTLAGVELLAGGVTLAVLCVITGELRGFRVQAVSADSLFALAYLTLAGTVLSFAAYVWLLDRVDPTLVATYTFVNPVIAVILGWAFLEERPTAGMLVGAPLIVGAVATAWLIDRKQQIVKNEAGVSRR